MTIIEPPGTISIPALALRNWTRILARACIALSLAAGALLHAQSPARKDWQLTWSDEFNSRDGSSPDPAKWRIVNSGIVHNNELETYTSRPENVLQKDGNLIITARKEDLTGADGISRHYTSGRLNTQGLFTQAYGRFEARIQLPVGKGIWPAFWLLGDNHEVKRWPACGEIDIMETIGAPDTMYSTIHGPDYSGSKGPSTKFALPAGEAVNTGFHVYAVEWSPNDIKFFFDDRLIVERTPVDLPAGATWVFDHPFYILLNFAVGGKWPGNPDDTTIFPQQMLVDYVRVYTSKPAAVAAAKQGRQ
jgi:beta-glucanase (GH16 family)